MCLRIVLIKITFAYTCEYNRGELSLWYVPVSLKSVFTLKHMILPWIIAVTCQYLRTGQVINANYGDKCCLKCSFLMGEFRSTSPIQYKSWHHGKMLQHLCNLKQRAQSPWLAREFSHTLKEARVFTGLLSGAGIPKCKFWIFKIELSYCSYFFLFAVILFAWLFRLGSSLKPKYFTQLVN